MLAQILKDKDALASVVHANKETHMIQLDDMTDRIGNQARNWVEQLIGGLREREYQRNRDRVMEIGQIIERRSDVMNKV